MMQRDDTLVKDKSKKQIKSVNTVMVLQIIIGLVCGLTCYFLRVPVSTAVIFWIFQFLGVFIPGSALSLFIKVRIKNSINLIMYSYAWGLALLLVQYFITINVHSVILNSILFIGIELVAIYYLIKNWDKLALLSADRMDICFFGALVGIVYFIDMFAVAFVNAMPNVSGRSGYYIDWMFWVGNNFAASRGLPLDDFRLVGKPLAYHFFTSAIVAEINQLTAINIKVLSFYFSYFINGVLIVSAGYSLFDKIIKSRILKFFSMAIFLFTDGTSITYGRHVYFCPFGFDLGYAMAIIAFIILLDIIDDEEINVKHLISSVVFVAICTGSKGPVALVMLIGYFVAGVRFLIKRKWKVAFIYGISWVLSFLCVYMLFMVNYGVTAEKGTLFYVGLRNAVDYNKWAYSEYLMLGDGLSQGIRRILAVAMYVFHVNDACITLWITSIVFMIYCAIKKKNVSFCLYACAAIVLWGTYLTASTVQEGGSQMYFATAVIPYGIACGMMSVEKLKETLSEKKYWVQIIIAVVLVAFAFSTSYFWNQIIIPKAQEGYANISGEIYYYSRNVDSVDMEAYEWIYNHTDKDDIIVVDSFENEDGYTQDMVVGVFTERHVWNDGMYSVYEDEVAYRKQVVNDFMNGSKEAYGILKENDVKFIIETDRRNDEKLENLELNCAFENESIRIFEL